MTWPGTAAQPQTLILPHPQARYRPALRSRTVLSVRCRCSQLVIVILVLCFAGVAGYFLAQLENTRSQLMLATLEIVKTCVVDRKP
jgi:hypothetical protein